MIELLVVLAAQMVEENNEAAERRLQAALAPSAQSGEVEQVRNILVRANAAVLDELPRLARGSHRQLPESRQEDVKLVVKALNPDRALDLLARHKSDELLARLSRLTAAAFETLTQDLDALVALLTPAGPAAQLTAEPLQGDPLWSNLKLDLLAATVLLSD